MTAFDKAKARAVCEVPTRACATDCEHIECAHVVELENRIHDRARLLPAALARIEELEAALVKACEVADALVLDRTGPVFDIVRAELAAIRQKAGEQ